VAVPVGHCIVFSNRRGSGSFGLPRSLHGLGRCRPDPRGIPGSTAPDRAAAPQMLRIHTNRGVPRNLAPLLQSALALPELLAASEEASSSSSLGIRSRIAPLSFDLLCVHSRKPRLPSARSCQGPDPVPSSWSLTTSTVCSAQGLRVCCTPLTTLGFDAFLAGTPRRRPGWVALERPSPSPRRESYPSKSSPHQQPYRITAALALLPLLLALLAWTARPRSSEVPSQWPEPLFRACALRGRSLG
jgi:hypothetical protein